MPPTPVVLGPRAEFIEKNLGCGEGAGYAGGIVSAGVDGERCAEAVANYINH